MHTWRDYKSNEIDIQTLQTRRISTSEARIEQLERIFFLTSYIFFVAGQPYLDAY